MRFLLSIILKFIVCTFVLYSIPNMLKHIKFNGDIFIIFTLLRHFYLSTFSFSSSTHAIFYQTHYLLFQQNTIITVIGVKLILTFNAISSSSPASKFKITFRKNCILIKLIHSRYFVYFFGFCI